MLSIKEKTQKTMKPNSRAYMSSYEWNYMTLELVDYIENNLSSKKEGDDSWKLFKEYCEEKKLNWRVIKKMLEFTVVKVFFTEENILKCEEFLPLESRLNIISDDKMETECDPFQGIELPF